MSTRKNKEEQTKAREAEVGKSLHPDAVTRRQLLGMGIGTATAYLLPLGLTDLLWGRRAFGADCSSGNGAQWVPFMLFDCVGGASFAGNWVTGKQGGSQDYLSSYDQLGIPTSPQNGGKIDTQFGVPMFQDYSKIYAGLIATASAEARAGLRMATICNQSQDDSPANLLSPTVMISRAGLKGGYFDTGLGTTNSASGGNSAGPVEFGPMKPLAVQSSGDVLGALGYGAALDRLPVKQKDAMARSIARLSAAQAQRLAGMSFADQLQTLTGCGYQKNIDFAQPLQGIDPSQDANATAVYGLTAATPAAQTQAPAIVYNVLKGNCGPGVLTIAGCDYHDGTQTTGDTKDLEIGQDIGRAVELAHRMNTPLFFAVVTDGGLYSDPGTRNWRGDSGIRGLAVMGYFRPGGPPTQRRTQLGAFTDGQGVDRSTYVGSDPKRVAFAIFANYLQVNGQLGLFSQQVSTSDFATEQIDAHLVFA
jgi:hypothetical protein